MSHKTFPKDGIKKLKETIRNLKSEIKRLEAENRFLKGELVNTIPNKEPAPEKLDLSQDDWRKDFLRRIKDGK